MALGTLSLLATLALAAGGDGSTDLAALSPSLPAASIAQALPPPPSKVELKTGYFGTVTVDHEAHLRRDAHCRDCHGPGRVGPIAFTPREAHDRCRTCHSERQKGPTDCRGCHALPAQAPAAAEAPAQPPAAALTAASAAGSAAASAAASSAGPSADSAAGPSAAAAPAPDGEAAPQAAVAAGGSAAPTAAVGAASVHEEVRLDEPPPPVPFLRSIQVGGVAGAGAGLSARVSLRRDELVLSNGVDVLAGASRSRTLVTMGVGISRPLEWLDALRLDADGLGGLDVAGSPDPEVMAALGARVGLAWAPPWARGFPLFVTLTGLVDLFHGGLATPACAYATIGVGTRPAPR